MALLIYFGILAVPLYFLFTVIIKAYLLHFYDIDYSISYGLFKITAFSISNKKYGLELSILNLTAGAQVPSANRPEVFGIRASKIHIKLTTCIYDLFTAQNTNHQPAATNHAMNPAIIKTISIIVTTLLKYTSVEINQIKLELGNDELLITVDSDEGNVLKSVPNTTVLHKQQDLIKSMSLHNIEIKVGSSILSHTGTNNTPPLPPLFFKITMKLIVTIASHTSRLIHPIYYIDGRNSAIKLSLETPIVDIYIDPVLSIIDKISNSMTCRNNNNIDIKPKGPLQSRQDNKINDQTMSLINYFKHYIDNYPLFTTYYIDPLILSAKIQLNIINAKIKFTKSSPTMQCIEVTNTLFKVKSKIELQLVNPKSYVLDTSLRIIERSLCVSFSNSIPKINHQNATKFIVLGEISIDVMDRIAIPVMSQPIKREYLIVPDHHAITANVLVGDIHLLITEEIVCTAIITAEGVARIFPSLLDNNCEEDKNSTPQFANPNHQEKAIHSMLLLLQKLSITCSMTNVTLQVALNDCDCYIAALSCIALQKNPQMGANLGLSNVYVYTSRTSDQLYDLFTNIEALYALSYDKFISLDSLDLKLNLDNLLRPIFKIKIEKATIDWRFPAYLGLYLAVQRLALTARNVLQSNSQLTKNPTPKMAAPNNNEVYLLLLSKIDYRVKLTDVHLTASLFKNQSITVLLPILSGWVHGFQFYFTCPTLTLFINSAKIAHANSVFLHLNENNATVNSIIASFPDIPVHSDSFASPIVADKCITLTFDHLNVEFPFLFKLGNFIEVFINTVKICKSQFFECETAPDYSPIFIPQTSFKLPSIELKGNTIIVNFLNDPFEAQLSKIFELQMDECLERVKREIILKEKIKRVNALVNSNPNEHLDSIDEKKIMGLLSKKNAQIYIERFNNLFKDGHFDTSSNHATKEDTVANISVISPVIILFPDQLLQGIENCFTALRYIDRNTELPKQSYIWDTIIGFKLFITAEHLKMMLYDYDNPFIELSSFSAKGTLILAEEEPEFPYGYYEYKEKVTNKLPIFHLFKKLSQFKVFSELFLDVHDTISVSWSPAYEAALDMLDLFIEGLVPVSALSMSSTLTVFDKIRLLLHGRAWVNAKKIRFFMPISVNPLISTEGFLFVANDCRFGIGDACLYLQGQLDVYLRSSTKYDESHLIAATHFYIMTEFVWSILGPPEYNHYFVIPVNPKYADLFKDNQIHCALFCDPFYYFRVKGVTLKLNLKLSSYRHKNEVETNYLDMNSFLESIKVEIFSNSFETCFQLPRLFTKLLLLPRRGKLFDNIVICNDEKNSYYQKKKKLGDLINGLILDLSFYGRGELWYWSEHNKNEGINLQTNTISFNLLMNKRQPIANTNIDHKETHIMRQGDNESMETAVSAHKHNQEYNSDAGVIYKKQKKPLALFDEHNRPTTTDNIKRMRSKTYSSLVDSNKNEINEPKQLLSSRKPSALNNYPEVNELEINYMHTDSEEREEDEHEEEHNFESNFPDKKSVLSAHNNFSLGSDHAHGGKILKTASRIASDIIHPIVNSFSNASVYGNTSKRGSQTMKPPTNNVVQRGKQYNSLSMSKSISKPILVEGVLYYPPDKINKSSNESLKKNRSSSIVHKASQPNALSTYLTTNDFDKYRQVKPNQRCGSAFNDEVNDEKNVNFKLHDRLALAIPIMPDEKQDLIAEAAEWNLQRLSLMLEKLELMVKPDISCYEKVGLYNFEFDKFAQLDKFVYILQDSKMLHPDEYAHQATFDGLKGTWSIPNSIFLFNFIDHILTQVQFKKDLKFSPKQPSLKQSTVAALTHVDTDIDLDLDLDAYDYMTPTPTPTHPQSQAQVKLSSNKRKKNNRSSVARSTDNMIQKLLAIEKNIVYTSPGIEDLEFAQKSVNEKKNAYHQELHCELQELEAKSAIKSIYIEFINSQLYFKGIASAERGGITIISERSILKKIIRYPQQTKSGEIVVLSYFQGYLQSLYIFFVPQINKLFVNKDNITTGTRMKTYFDSFIDNHIWIPENFYSQKDHEILFPLRALIHNVDIEFSYISSVNFHEDKDILGLVESADIIPILPFSKINFVDMNSSLMLWSISSFVVNTQSIDFDVLCDILINNLDRSTRDAEEHESIKFSLQLLDIKNYDKQIYRLKEKIRKGLVFAKLLERELYFMSDYKTLNTDPNILAPNFETLKPHKVTLIKSQQEIKEALRLYKIQLRTLVKVCKDTSFKTRVEEVIGSLGSTPLSVLEFSLQEGVWFLNDTTDNSLLEIKLEGFNFTRTTYSNESFVTDMSAININIKNNIKDDFYQQVLCPLEEDNPLNSVNNSINNTNSQGFDRDLIFRIHSRERPAVNGIPIKEHFEVNISPVKLQLTLKLYHFLFYFFFPETASSWSANDKYSLLEYNINIEKKYVRLIQTYDHCLHRTTKIWTELANAVDQLFIMVPGYQSAANESISTNLVECDLYDLFFMASDKTANKFQMNTNIEQLITEVMFLWRELGVFSQRLRLITSKMMLNNYTRSLLSSFNGDPNMLADFIIKRRLPAKNEINVSPVLIPAYNCNETIKGTPANSDQLIGSNSNSSNKKFGKYQSATTLHGSVASTSFGSPELLTNQVSTNTSSNNTSKRRNSTGPTTQVPSPMNKLYVTKSSDTKDAVVVGPVSSVFKKTVVTNMDQVDLGMLTNMILSELEARHGMQEAKRAIYCHPTKFALIVLVYKMGNILAQQNQAIKPGLLVYHLEKPSHAEKEMISSIIKLMVATLAPSLDKLLINNKIDINLFMEKRARLSITSGMYDAYSPHRSPSFSRKAAHESMDPVSLHQSDSTLNFMTPSKAKQLDPTNRALFDSSPSNYGQEPVAVMGSHNYSNSIGTPHQSGMNEGTSGITGGKMTKQSGGMASSSALLATNNSGGSSGKAKRKVPPTNNSANNNSSINPMGSSYSTSGSSGSAGNGQKFDVELMRARAANNISFGYIKIPSSSLYLCIKMKEKAIYNVDGFVFQLPTLEYHDITWTWQDILFQIKKDCLSIFISQVMKHALIKSSKPTASSTNNSNQDGGSQNMAKLIMGKLVSRPITQMSRKVSNATLDLKRKHMFTNPFSKIDEQKSDK